MTAPVNLNGAELALLTRIKEADGRIPADGLSGDEREPAKRLVYLGFLDHVPGHLVLTKAGAQALSHQHP
ncbi:hypothetical protein K1W54_04340 [Micromonospora sp. CPCC 205371]|nr:hypothetical protein [Micromonospora sp. CPCC 205371]